MAAVTAGNDKGFTFAVIGDVPYGPTQITEFPSVVDQINADPDVRLVDHLGDIKDGSSLCSDSYFARIRSDFDRFADPLVYTPGDNEWTDCHRANNGSYNPLERLTAIRRTFFPEPGRTLGQHKVAVKSQAAAGYAENVRYTRADVTFAAVHVVGSNNSLLPWTGNTSATPEQLAEVRGRTAAAVQHIRETFAQAKRDRDRAVVLLTQADMFDPSVSNPNPANLSGFTPIIQTIAEQATAFDGPVYLFNGDSHVYNADRPLANGSKWLSVYGVSAVPNLNRITVDGSTGVNSWLKVTINARGPQVLSWVKVPYASNGS
ncbi:metallophosphoesterase [Actinopolymorpha alba]|uniref:metallophosphoesterase n=1 Tax=Actinopolymorpha alba TaxID=533267 RepID=UPI003B5065A1